MATTIKKKILLLLILAIGGSMLLAGLTLSLLIKKNYENSAIESFRSYYELAATEFRKIDLDTLFYTNALAKRESLINSLNLISVYADREKYQPIIFDEEKKKVARTLINYARSLQLNEISVYDDKGMLTAFTRPSDLGLGIVSYENAEPVILHAADGENVTWNRAINNASVPELVYNPDSRGDHSHYVYRNGTASAQAVVSIFRELPDGRKKPVGTLMLQNPVGESFLYSLSKGSQALHGILLPDGNFLGDSIPGFTPALASQSSNLFQVRDIDSLQLLETSGYYMNAFYIPLKRSAKLYLVSSLDQKVVNNQITNTIRVVFVIFAVSSLVLLPIGLLFARISITSPIDRLVQAADSMGKGSYQPLHERFSTSHELNALSQVLNKAADTVLKRERELRDSQTQLESHVRERTRDLVLANEKLKKENHDRLIAERELNKSTRMLQLVMENIPQYIFWKDNQSEYLGCNRNFLNLCGLQQIEDIIGKSDFDLPWSREKSEGYRSDDLQVMHQDKPAFNSEEEITRPDGQTIIVNTNKIPLHDEEQRVIGVLGTFTDITESRRSQAILEENEARFRGLFDLSPYGIALNAMDGSFIDVNQSFLDFTGYTRDELIKMSYWDLIPGEYRQKQHEQLESLNTTGRYGPSEKEYVHKKGHRFPVLLEGKMLFNRSGEANIYSIVQDVTERKKFESELVKAKVIAEKANLAKSEFLSRMSHELRTPMNAILGFAQLMQMNADQQLTEENLANVDEILTAGYHLLDLINEVLDLTSIESGGINLKLEQIKVAEVVKSSIKMTRSLAESHEVVLNDETVKCHQRLIKADLTRIKQVLVNLISNAIKYNRPGGSVILRCYEPEQDRLRFEVEDTGIGIDEEKLDRLFKPFDRLEIEEQGIDGTGIGLVICKEVLSHMGGRIGVDSNHGVGTTFWFDLPLDKADKNEVTGSTKIRTDDNGANV